MTKEQALYTFFNSFLTAYEASSVPDDVTFPYMVYDGSTGAYAENASPVSITARLFFYTESNAVPSAKVAQISSAIGYDGVRLACDNGFVWVLRGSPFCVSSNDETDKTIKVRALNLTLVFMTL